MLAAPVVIIDDDDCEPLEGQPMEDTQPESDVKRRRCDHEIIADQQKDRIQAAMGSAQAAVASVEMLRSLLCDVTTALFRDDQAPITLQAVESALEMTQDVPAILARIRRHHRHVSSLSVEASRVLDDMKQRRRYLIQQYIDYQAQLAALRRQTRTELTAAQIPKFMAILPQLCSKEEFEASEALVGEGRPERYSEEYYLRWLNFDLSSRADEMTRIEEARAIRLAEEEKVKLLKKREADLATKIAPIEKELTRLLTSVSPTTPPPISFPSKAYSLPPPLFHLFTQLFAYKIVNGDASVDARLSFQSVGTSTAPAAPATAPPTSSSSPTARQPFSLFHSFPGRFQVVIDKAPSTRLPPSTYSRAAPLFPLTVRFTYYPYLDVVSAMCQFPRVIGSDVTFLADLFFPNDDGTVSPNPLHHVVTDMSQLIPASVEGSAPTAAQSDMTKTPTPEGVTVAQQIAAKISELQHGRVYRWAQVLAGLVPSVDVQSVPGTSSGIPSDVVVDVKFFINTFRDRVSFRAWALHVEESLKHQPRCVPPPGVPLPVSLNAVASSCAAMVESFTSITPRAFLAAGGSPTVVSASAGRDVRFLKGHIMYQNIPFAVCVAVPLDTRHAIFCIQVRAAPTQSQLKEADLNPKAFSLPGLMEYTPTTASLESLGLDATEQQAIQEAVAHLGPSERTDEEKQLDLLKQLLPAAQFGWDEIILPTGGVFCKPTHFRHASLAAIQQTINETVPAAYSGKTYAYAMFTIQFVALCHKLQKWVESIAVVDTSS